MPVHTTAGSPVWTQRFRQVVVSVFLVVFCLVQDPRLVAADTKLDLSVDPWGFLRRALSLWDPTGAAGQLQNQAYGYLFPMGPFFGLGHSLGMPAWVVQRLWWALLLLLAYHGMRRLSAAMGIGSPTTQTIAALAYALCPRITAGLGAISVELWPMALAPWVILPLVDPARRGPRRAAGLSALAVACVGGVNAVATGAVLVLPFLFLTLRLRSALHRRTLAWWGLFVFAATVWWLVPLVLLGRYSPPFLDWIESASVTTTLGSLPEALRGTTHWVAGIVTSGGAQWPAAHEVLVSRAGVLAGLEIAVLGVWGLARHDLRHARFLRVALVAGLVLLTLGHTGGLAAPWAGTLQSLLDGPLAPARNLHKFDLVVRLPLALGLAHVLAVAQPRLRQVSWGAALLPGVTVLAMIALLAPAAASGISQARSFSGVPSWWSEAARYLGERPGDRTLILPGSAFFVGQWGATRDEPIQPLATAPWMVRDAVPLGSAGATRQLTAIEQTLATGHGGESLANLFVALGVDRLLVRADLDWRVTGAPPPMVVRQALAETPGVTPGQTFGPVIGGSFRSDLAIDDGIDQAVPTLQVFELTSSPSTQPSMLPASDVSVLNGGAEGVGQAPARGHWVLASDRRSVDVVRAAGGAAAVTATDTQQRREASFASVRDNYGPIIGADEPYTSKRASHDYLTPGAEQPEAQSTRVREGGVRVTASSSVARPLFGQQLQLARGPDAAFDGSGDTSWVSARAATGSWLRVRWPESVSLPDVVPIQLDSAAGADVSAIELRTDRGTVRTPVDASGADATQTVQAAALSGLSHVLEVRVVAVRGDRNLPAAVREVGFGVLRPAPSSIEVPQAGQAEATRFVLAVRGDALHPCVRDVSRVARCQQLRNRQGEESVAMRRTLAPSAGIWTITGSVTARPGEALNRLLDAQHPVAVASDSVWLDDPLVRPGNMVDGDPSTYWASNPLDRQPSVTLTLPRVELVDRVRIDTDAAILGARPKRVRVSAPGLDVVREVDLDGTVALPEVRTKRLTVTVVESTTSTSVRTGGSTTGMPVVVGEIHVGANSRPAQADDETGRACGFGPDLVIDDERVATQVTGSLRDVEAGRAVTLRACSPVSFDGGTHTVSVVASGEFVPATLTLSRNGSPEPAQSTPRALTWANQGSTERSVVVPERAETEVLMVPENQNDAWVATLDGKPLTALRMDGWRQAWVVPAGGEGTVRLEFAPQRLYAVGLGIGVLGLMLVLVAALVPSRAPVAATPASGRKGRTSAVPVAAAALGVVAIGGSWGLAAVAVAYVARRVAGAGEATVLLVGAALIGVSVWAPWPAVAATNHGAVAQALALLLVGLVVTAGTRSRQRGWRRVPQVRHRAPDPVPGGSAGGPT